MYGAQGENLKCVTRNDVVPAVFADDAERRVRQLPFTGEAFNKDDKQVHILFVEKFSCEHTRLDLD